MERRFYQWYLCKGNFEVDVIWENHQLKEAVVRSNAGGDCVIKYADQTISFKTVKGRSYQIGYDAAKGLIKNKHKISEN